VQGKAQNPPETIADEANKKREEGNQQVTVTSR